MMESTQFNGKKFLVSGLIGGMVAFFAGFLIYGILLKDVMSGCSGTATNVMRGQNEMIFWSIILGSIFMSLIMSYVFNKWADINTPGDGLIAGAVLGFLITGSYDFMNYGTTHLMNLKGLWIDMACGTLLNAITGAAVAFINGKIK